MVDERIADGRRIAQLLASEVRGRERGPLGRLAVVDVRDVEGCPVGEFAFGVDARIDSGSLRIADVHVHDDRTRIEFREAPDAAADAGRRAGLRTRPKAGNPPKTVVFLDDGVAAKRALPLFRAVVEALDGRDSSGAEAGTE
ncbi:hypothetical protein ACFQE8_15925 [Salinirubellus sp. GCM10025818]|uniref:hypothetical protein n=1 Tax=Salinirubellus TaxID=2162630 RepID=UPI0030CDC26B